MSSIDEKCVNTIRCMAADIVQKANSGHPGAPMGCAPMAHVLWNKVMAYSPANPKWANRDRFVLSNGHACALQYTMLHLTGYDISLEDLKSFRQLDSKTPGHPENHLTPGVEVSTGPLGQGISNAVGMALAESHLAAKYNKPDFPIVDHYTYVICGDGCMQEGVSAEASSFAGHLRLGKLIVLYDDNHITIDGSTDLSFSEDVCKRYEAYGWHTQVVENGDSDIPAILAAVERAKANPAPSLIKVRTTIGKGSKKQGTEHVHGAPLGNDDIKQVKSQFGLNPDASFQVPEDVGSVYALLKAKGTERNAAWDALFAAYSVAYPDLAADFVRTYNGLLPADFGQGFPRYKVTDAANATRKTSFFALEKVCAVLPEFIGGSADLTPSTLTKVDANKVDYDHSTPHGTYLRYGVREHAMAAVCNGICAHGGLIPFASTFLNFTGYALGAVRLSALSNFRVLYVMTHDSIGLGEDGPTHQPIEMLASLRSMPNMNVFRPADGNEVTGTYIAALSTAHTPSVIALSRQNCVNLEGTSVEAVAKGGYILTGDASPHVILVGTGSEVQLCAAAAKLLSVNGVVARVVSMPCMELFEAQEESYRRSVFPDGVPVVSVEAASIFGWEKYAHVHIGMTTFGLSAPGDAIFKHFGFTPANIAEKAQKAVAYYGSTAPLLFRPAL